MFFDLSRADRVPGERPDNEDSLRRMARAGIRGRSITTHVRSPPESSLPRGGSPSRCRRSSARTGPLSSRLDRMFPSPRAPCSSWDELPLDDPLLFVGNGPQLSWATAPTLALVGTGPRARGRGPPPWRAVSHLSSRRPLRPVGWTQLAPTPRGPGPPSSWDGYSPRASLVVSLASAGSSRDRAKPGLACTLAVAFSLRGRVALRTRCAR